MASQLSLEKPVFSMVAINVQRDMIYKVTEERFSSAMEKAWRVLSPTFIELVRRHRRALDRMIDDDRDSLFSQ